MWRKKTNWFGGKVNLIYALKILLVMLYSIIKILSISPTNS